MSNVLNAVVGFLFDDRRQQVVLLIRNSPAWQKGKFNGVGGKIEQGEKPVEAMVREFEEEAGVATDQNYWQHFASMELSPGGSGKYDSGTIYCFKAFNSEYVQKVHSATDEVVCVMSLDNMSDLDLAGGTRWLIPMALHDATIKAYAVVQ